MHSKKILYLILARGGSKGLPGKNIKDFCGKPLISWSIETIKNTQASGDIVISTDSQEIANIAKEYGAEVPFIRPDFLAEDTSTSMDAIFHALEYLESRNRMYDLIVLIEPTSPLREAKDIDNAITTLLESDNGESIVSISKTECQHPDFLISLGENNITKKFIEQKGVKRRQELNDLYFYEGSFYISTIKSLKENKGFYHEKTIGYPLPKWKSLEIDDIYDFVMCEALMKAKLNNIF